MTSTQEPNTHIDPASFATSYSDTLTTGHELPGSMSQPYDLLEPVLRINARIGEGCYQTPRRGGR